MTDLEFYKGLSYFLIGYGSFMLLVLPFELKRRKNITNYKDVWLTVLLSVITFMWYGVLLLFRSQDAFVYVGWVVVYLSIYGALHYYRKNKKDEK